VDLGLGAAERWLAAAPEGRREAPQP